MDASMIQPLVYATGLEVLLPLIATVGSAAATGVGVLGQIRQGQAQDQAAKAAAKQQEIAATQDYAAAQRQAELQAEETKRAAAEYTAKGAAAGGGRLGLLARLAAGEARGKVAEQSIYAQAGQARTSGQNAAAAMRAQGAAAKQAGIIGGIGTGLSGLAQTAGYASQTYNAYQKQQADTAPKKKTISYG